MDATISGTKAAIFGEYIRSRRKELSLTQETLASRVGIYQPFLSKVELGQTIPSLDVVASLAKELALPNCYLFSLLGRCEQPSYPVLLEVASDDEIQIRISDTKGKRITGKELELIKVMIRAILENQ
ncbi:MAG: helix-turn-helix transcriptional regulator [Chloroflexi bacterium]|nr:helix-turn-helix transcriptional regulator [Chloroflexota bacterium]